MRPVTHTAKVPGKVMLAGEYGVLLGGQALAATVDRWLTVEVTRRPDSAQDSLLSSNLWTGDVPLSLAAKRPDDLAWPMADSTARALAHFGLGPVHCRVRSDLNPKHGLGSSSALRLGLWHAVAACAAKPGASTDARALARAAFEDQKRLQGRASGYDVATQWQGGLVQFTPPLRDEPWPGPLSRRAESLTALLPWVHVWVGGKGAPTAPVLSDTMAWLERAGTREAILAANARLMAAFLDDPASLVAAAGDWHRAFREAPHYPRELAAGLSSLPGFGQSWSFKTTGAGGEDAFLLLGQEDALAPARDFMTAQGWRAMRGAFTPDGLMVNGKGVPRDEQAL